MPRATKSPNNKKAESVNGDAANNGSALAGNQKIPASALQVSSAPQSIGSRANLSRARSTDTSVYPSVSEEQIRRRAYELYTQRGGTHGKHADDWFRAEAELRSRS